MLKKHLYKMRRIMWPAYESEAVLNPKDVFKKYYDAIANLRYVSKKEILQELYNNCQDVYKDEEKRRLNIVQKAATSLGTTGASSAIVVGLASFLLSDKLRWDGVSSHLVFIAYIAALFYFIRSIVVALRSIGREQGVRYCIGPDDLPPVDRNESQYLLHLCGKYLEYTTENYKLNNRQLDTVGVSQESFRNGIIILLIVCSLVIGVRGFSIKEYESQGLSIKADEVRLIVSNDSCHRRSQDWSIRTLGIRKYDWTILQSCKCAKCDNQLKGR